MMNDDFVKDSDDPNQANIPTQYSVTAPPQTSGPPTSPTAMMLSAAMIVPNAEPWNIGHGPGANPGHSIQSGDNQKGPLNPRSIPGFS